MKLRNKNILLISPEPWDHIFVSKHHYATHLGKKENRIYFLNPPGNQNSVIKTTFKNVFSLSYSGFIRGMRFLPSFAEKKLIRKVYNQLENMCQVKFDIVWSFDNSRFYDFSALPDHVVKISHIVDLNQDFQTAKAATTANICFGVIPRLVERLHKYNKNSYLINHGVQKFSHGLEKIALPGHGTVKAMYIGNLAMPFIDWELLYQLAWANKEVDFIFVGSNHKASKNSLKTILQGLNNVFFLQPVAAIEIQKYLTSADILLLAYVPEYYNNYASPHKMMEYLASGKMICATFTAEYETLQKEDLIAMSSVKHDFPILFNNILNNLDLKNTEEKQTERKAFASENTYEKQIERIEKLLANNQAATFMYPGNISL